MLSVHSLVYQPLQTNAWKDCNAMVEKEAMYGSIVETSFACANTMDSTAGDAVEHLFSDKLSLELDMDEVGM